MDRSGAAILERPDRNGKQMLLTHTALEEYEKGVLLHIDGGDCAGVQIVKEGQVRVYITSPSGGEITLYRLVEGDVSILSASCMIKGMDISLDMMMNRTQYCIRFRKKFTRN